ncbi:O-acetyl-ADP-ribose deacetylase [Indiicoccus explosivorum]|uniref:O-acetyl-ADP-ribose deacetylase n=1 Tax=Indiicoccus explosivorum TaxID=1917864 RepID=UPI000B4511D2|nr:O-acetyl-ADP-ribose deacetylase [Indiicoccus explosivorum]
MKKEISGNTLELMTGDITKQETEAIVNAANGTLLGGGGVDGAIHRAAGPGLLEECKNIRREQLGGEKLPTGKAVITEGYRLPANFVIHTVGPVWSGKEGKKEQLADCYRNSLQLASDRGIRSISFPSISTGIYRFPIELAADTALRTISAFLETRDFGNVVMTLFSEKDYLVYENALKKIGND